MAQDFLLLVRYFTMMVDYAGAGALAKDLLESIEKYELMAAPDMGHRQEVYQIVKLVLESLPEAETIIQQEIKSITHVLQKLESLYPLIMSMYAIRHGWASTAYNHFMQSEFSFDKLLTIHPIAQVCVTNVPQFRLNHENLIHRVQKILLIKP
jgi:phage gp29-like protein